MQPITQQNPMTRLVSDAMHEGILTCDRDASLADVARTMAEERVHCVVVESGSGESGPLWGIVSDLDLVAAASVRRPRGPDRGRLCRKPDRDGLRRARRSSGPPS